MTRLQELIQKAVDSPLAIEILENTFNDLMVNYDIEETDLLNNLSMNIDEWDK